MLENRVLRKIFLRKKDEVTGEWRRLYKELYDLYPSLNIILGIKSRRMRRAEHVARIGEWRAAYGVSWGNLRERDHLEDLYLSGRMMLRQVDRQVVGIGSMYWIALAQDRDRWRALVNAVMNFRVPFSELNISTS